MKAHHQILIIGGGNAGLSVAAQLLNKNSELDVAIIEPSEDHYYQPAWTLVGGGAFDINKTRKKEKDFIPKGATWIKAWASDFEPDNNVVHTKDGRVYTYDYLVVCPGIQINWGAVEGLEETLNKNGVCSNYSFHNAPYTYEVLKNFKGGVALFTNPGTPVKCGGAPQKIMYLASDYLRKEGLLKDTEVHFCTAGKTVFGVQKYRDALLKVIDRYGIQVNYGYDLTKVDGEKKEATFKVKMEDGSVQEKVMKFDMLHVTPPQSSPDFIAQSPLSNEKGWVDVNKFTLQHNKYPNVFSLGDVASTPNAKTGAAVRKQAPVLVENLLTIIKAGSPHSKYSGYGSCPLVTGYGKLILAEFDYSGEPAETFPFNQAKERWSMWMLKTKILPWMYWNRILTGKA
jgi:sulfide:quinone oxidoreductase